MMTYEQVKNTPFTINLIPEVVNGRDWNIFDTEIDQAVHSEGNNDFIELKNFPMIIGRSYEYSYYVDEIQSGYVQLVAGGDTSQPHETTSGLKAGSFTATTTESLKFYATGVVAISKVNLKILEVETTEDTRTIVYDELTNKWTSYRNYVPDVGVSLFNDLFTFKDGRGYIHSDKENRNTFYGIKYDTRIRFPVSSVGVKTYQSIAVHSNKVIGTTEDGIVTQLGHVSDLVKEDFITREGIHYANFYRDKFTGLLDGERLKGRYIIIEFEDKCGKKLHIFKTVVKSQMSTPNE